MSRNSLAETVPSETDMASLAQQFVLNLFNQKSDPRLVYHTYRQTLDVAKAVDTLAQENGLTQAEWEAASIASRFVNTGHLIDYEHPLPKCIELAEKFLNAHNFPTEKKEEITGALKSVRSDQTPKTVVAQLLSDAVQSVRFGNGFSEQSPLEQLEVELIHNQIFTKEEWDTRQLELLLRVRFYTPHAKVVFEPMVANHLMAIKERVDRQRSKTIQNNDPSKKFRRLEKRISPGAQTFFRTSYRTHINLSAIADNKANIMISVNAILISVIISVISYRNMTETTPAILMPVIIFLVMGLASLIFAVLAARPKITSIVNDRTPLEETKKNMIFFGNFVTLKLEKYEELMDELFNDTELLYGNMTRDLYYLGKVLDKKYRYLSISYNVFMVGFIATVVSFLVALFT